MISHTHACLGTRGKSKKFLKYYRNFSDILTLNLNINCYKKLMSVKCSIFLIFYSQNLVVK